MMNLQDPEVQDEKVKSSLPKPQSPITKAIGGSAIIAVIAFALWRQWYTIMAVAIAFVLMICLHELGHFLAARWTGMKVSGFYFGFGPRIWSTQRGETEYGIRPLPLGAYVRILGMSNLEKDIDSDEEHRTYRSKPYSSRLIVALAGSLMHFILAFATLWALFGIVGFYPLDATEIERSREWQIVQVTPQDPADIAGFLPGDKIIAADGQRYGSFEEVADFINERPGQRATFQVQRGDQELTLMSNIKDEDGRGLIGITIERGDPKPLGFFSSFRESVTEYGELFRLSGQGFVQIFSPGGISNMWDTVFGDGPEATGDGTQNTNRATSIYGVSRVAVQFGDAGDWGTLMLLYAAVNIFIGIFNLVPLPPLDGGHVAVATYEKLRSKRDKPYRIDAAKLLPLQFVVLALILVFFALVLSGDIIDPIL